MTKELLVLSVVSCPKTHESVAVGKCLFGCEYFNDYGGGGYDEGSILCSYEEKDDS